MTTAVVSPEKPKATSQSAVMTVNGTFTISSVVFKLKTAVKTPDGEHVKSGQKCKPDENKTSLAKKKLPNSELTHNDFMDLNNVKAAHVQSDSNGKL